ncbi:NAD(P)H-quinone oxidoreductase subunit K [Striga asiatica]|uniref:NAD(P)H-quinone oxidoreductase subunit K n=1 Tax=Striga asiatica TaxID=4170 RepID=A0A5A7PAD2_STRAF|nr:NAD(P)H-quinone oxidoreductase subunit K [Striga asiatica]
MSLLPLGISHSALPAPKGLRYRLPTRAVFSCFRFQLKISFPQAKPLRRERFPLGEGEQEADLGTLTQEVFRVMRLKTSNKEKKKAKKKDKQGKELKRRSRFDFDCYGLVPRSSPRQADLILTARTSLLLMLHKQSLCSSECGSFEKFLPLYLSLRCLDFSKLHGHAPVKPKKINQFSRQKKALYFFVRRVILVLLSI